MNKLGKVGQKAVRVLIFYLGLIGVWYLLWYFLVEKYGVVSSNIFVEPEVVARSLYGFLIKNDNNFWRQMAKTLERLVIGYGVSVAVGVVIAGLIFSLRGFGGELRALLAGLQSLPNMCWVPFAIIICGLDANAVYFVIVIGSAPAIALSVESSLRNISPTYIRVGKTLGCNRVGMLTRIYLPASLPAMVAGLKHAWAFAWRALMAGEMNCLFAVNASGLGYLMFNLRYSGALDKVICIMLVLVAVGVLFDKAVFGTVENAILTKHGIRRNDQ